MVHVGLESGRGVAQAEEHDCQFKTPKQGGEGHFPSVFGTDEDVIVSPANVEFGEDFAIF